MEILSAHSLLIGAEADMSVDSGLPDFRGDQGFWRAYPPLERLGTSMAEMANPAGSTGIQRWPGVSTATECTSCRQPPPHESSTSSAAGRVSGPVAGSCSPQTWTGGFSALGSARTSFVSATVRVTASSASCGVSAEFCRRPYARSPRNVRVATKSRARGDNARLG